MTESLRVRSLPRRDNLAVALPSYDEGASSAGRGRAAKTTASPRGRRTDVETIEPRRSLLDRLLRPSMPLRMAIYFVAWLALLVVVALLWGDPGCSGEGMVLR